MENNIGITKWKEYQQQTSSGKPRALLVKALVHVSARGVALDLGAGALNETQYLFDSGFKHVIAVDITPQFKKVSIKEDSSFEYCECGFETYHFQGNYFDVISSQFSLPFTEKKEFSRVWKDLTKSLKRGGIFCGQLFGKKDDWEDKGTIVTHTKEEIIKILKDFEILYLEEIENDSKTARGEQKHWHYFEIIAKKK